MAFRILAVRRPLELLRILGCLRLCGVIIAPMDRLGAGDRSIAPIPSALPGRVQLARFAMSLTPSREAGESMLAAADHPERIGAGDTSEGPLISVTSPLPAFTTVGSISDSVGYGPMTRHPVLGLEDDGRSPWAGSSPPAWEADAEVQVHPV